MSGRMEVWEVFSYLLPLTTYLLPLKKKNYGKEN